MTIAASSPRTAPPGRFNNGADWLHALGGVPLERFIFDAWPGTATEADLLHYVERDRLCELVDGTLVEKPVGYVESLIAMQLGRHLLNFCEPRNLGFVSGEASTMRMASSGRVRLPDVAFISADRLPKSVGRILALAPDLAVEVLSEGNTAAEMEQKLREYFQSGTRLVWFVDPARRCVAVYHAPGAPARVLQESDALDGEQVIPGFSMPIADLFRNVPRVE